jgi:hypothetical protein
MLLHWVHGGAFLETFPVRCLAYVEAMAEKLRAARSRPEVAIRDFSDIDHAVRVAGALPRGDSRRLPIHGPYRDHQCRTRRAGPRRKRAVAGQPPKRIVRKHSSFESLPSCRSPSEKTMPNVTQLARHPAHPP